MPPEHSPHSPLDDPPVTVWSEPFRIRAYEAGPDERASALTVCNLFQEAAGEQARAFGFDVFDLPTGTATWVLNRLCLAIDGPLPLMRDEVTVETWPSGRDGLRASRDFRLRGASGEIAVRATSVWFLIDIARRRPVRLPPEMGSFELPGEGRALVPGDVPTAPDAVEREERFAVRHADLDRVGHANHVRVVEWALEAVPGTVRPGHRLAGLDVQFQTEATVGDVAVSACGTGANGGLAHRISRASDDRTLALARTLWI